MVLLFLTVCLTLATGVEFLGTAAALSNELRVVRTTGTSTANAELVADFYAAINRALDTGDVSPLDTLVTPDVIWCASCPGQRPGRAGLAHDLSGVHRTMPDVRLSVDSVVADPGPR